jgi:hypothetical protein
MLNIELPWVDGFKLTRRWWGPFLSREAVDCEELHHCIFELGLPVYNFDRELQEGIVDLELWNWEKDCVIDKKIFFIFSINM